MLITSSIPNLINGVSQQPPTLRLASQAEEQVNFLSSVADGLTVRPASRHVAKVDTVPWSDAFLHTINRDTTERYLVVIRQNTLRVFEAETGVERTVNAPDGWGYITGASKTNLRAVTVADYTFILNRDMMVTMNSATSAARPNKALVYIKAGNYGKKYRILIDGVARAEYQTPDGGASNHSFYIDTGNIAQELLNDLNAWGGGGNYTFSRAGDVITITRSDNTAFTVRAEDGSGGANISAIYDKVQRFSDLPQEAPDGFVVEVVGDQSSGFDNYFVKYDIGGGSTGVGVWKETLKGGEQYKLSGWNMPHVLVRESNGTFTFKEASWVERDVGDLSKMPFPSFANRKIRDIFFFQNRLGLVADENIVLSQDGEYFDFFRSTATTVLDTDPIDIAVTSERVSLINFAVPFNRTLLLFSDQSQFVMEGGSVLTPETASVAQATSFESLPRVRPVGVGQYVYFPVPRGGNSAVREYFVQEGNEQNDALDVTSHVPRFLPKGLFKMAASSSEDTLVALSDLTPSDIWVYRFFFNQEGKLQSAWSKWSFSTEDTILSVEFIESRLYLVSARSDGTYIEAISLESGAVDTGSTIHFRLDRGVDIEDCTAVYDGSDFTDITLPYATDAALHVVVRGDDPTYSEGLAVPVYSRPDSLTVRLRGDWQNAKLIIGQQFLARYVFSTFFMRSSEPGGGVSANADGRLQLRYFAVDYDNAGYFRLVSQPRGRQRFEKTFSGRVLGVESGTTGSFNLATGRFRIPVMCRNLDAYLAIETDSFLPASFTAGEWEASFNTRSRKV